MSKKCWMPNQDLRSKNALGKFTALNGSDSLPGSASQIRATFHLTISATATPPILIETR